MAVEPHIVAGTTIARAGVAVLLRGPSGRGKSDLALRAITSPLQLPGEDRPSVFELVSDDQTALDERDGSIIVSPPPALGGLLEVRGVGIIQAGAPATARLALIADLTDGSAPIERLPEEPWPTELLLHHPIRVMPVAPLDASAPAKIALALRAAALAGD